MTTMSEALISSTSVIGGERQNGHARRTLVATSMTNARQPMLLIRYERFQNFETATTGSSLKLRYFPNQCSDRASAFSTAWNMLNDTVSLHRSIRQSDGPLNHQHFSRNRGFRKYISVPRRSRTDAIQPGLSPIRRASRIVELSVSDVLEFGTPRNHRLCIPAEPC